MGGEPKRKKVAIEPDKWSRVDKVCPYCESSGCKFKYLNNHKHDQPCYWCLDCKKNYVMHAQNGARRPQS